MSKKVKRTKSKSRRARDGGAAKAVGGAPPTAATPAAAPPAPEGPTAEPQVPSPELLVAPKAPKAPQRIKAQEKLQKSGRSGAFGGHNDTSQLRTKARAQQQKMQGQRNGNR